eukprot:g16516.t1
MTSPFNPFYFHVDDEDILIDGVPEDDQKLQELILGRRAFVLYPSEDAVPIPHMQHVVVFPEGQSQFHWRRQSQEGRISTIEAAALVLEELGELNTEHLLRALELLMDALGRQCHHDTLFQHALPKPTGKKKFALGAKKIQKLLPGQRGSQGDVIEEKAARGRVMWWLISISLPRLRLWGYCQHLSERPRDPEKGVAVLALFGFATSFLQAGRRRAASLERREALLAASLAPVLSSPLSAWAAELAGNYDDPWRKQRGIITLNNGEDPDRGRSCKGKQEVKYVVPGRMAGDQVTLDFAERGGSKVTAKFDGKTLTFPDGSAWTRSGDLSARSKFLLRSSWLPWQEHEEGRRRNQYEWNSVRALPKRAQRPPQVHTDAFQTPRQIALTSIAVVRSPYKERFGCPRQPSVTKGVLGAKAADCTLEFLPENIGSQECDRTAWDCVEKIRFALQDLEGFEVIWVISYLHMNEGAAELDTGLGREN